MFVVEENNDDGRLPCPVQSPPRKCPWSGSTAAGAWQRAEMSSYYEDGKEIIVIEDVSFASPEGGLLAGSAASSENSRGHSSLSKDVDTSTTSVHVSSDDESPVSKIWTACLPQVQLYK